MQDQWWNGQLLNDQVWRHIRRSFASVQRVGYDPVSSCDCRRRVWQQWKLSRPRKLSGNHPTPLPVVPGRKREAVVSRQVSTRINMVIRFRGKFVLRLDLASRCFLLLPPQQASPPLPPRCVVYPSAHPDAARDNAWGYSQVGVEAGDFRRRILITTPVTDIRHTTHSYLYHRHHRINVLIRFYNFSYSST